MHHKAIVLKKHIQAQDQKSSCRGKCQRGAVRRRSIYRGNRSWLIGRIWFGLAEKEEWLDEWSLVEEWLEEERSGECGWRWCGWQTAIKKDGKPSVTLFSEPFS
jgi:hypothetical protein